MTTVGDLPVMSDNEMKMRKDMQESAIEMLTVAGFKDVKGYDAA